jgi:hypothetical protein
LVLGDGFDDEIAILEILEVHRAMDPPQRVRLGLLVHPGLGHQALEALAQPAQPLVEKGLVGFDHDGRKAGLRRDLRDAGPHEPATDDAYVLDGHGRTTSLGELRIFT